jgi:DNA-binding NarL/FixJ family response regulator
MAAVIRLLIADDHVMFREMLALTLSRCGDFEVVGEAGDGKALLDTAQRTRPDVILLDYKMPAARDFIGLLQELRLATPNAAVIVLSGFANSDIAQRAADGGARGYVLKATKLSAVSDAVRAVARGGIWIDPSLPRRVFDLFQSQASGPVAGPLATAGLTRREREILASLAEGASNLEIARKLCISEPTVKTHVSHIFAKLNVKNRAEAAHLYYGRSADSADDPSAQAS